jgi:hypothetical protein
MKTTIETTSSMIVKPVEVTIAVTKFKDVLADAQRDGCGTMYTMKLGRKDPRAEIRGDDIYIQRPGAPIRFTIASARADRKRYYPVGIAFVREGGRNSGDEQRLGLLNFPQSQTRMARHTLLITDSYKDDAQYVRYKFSVIIQRGSDGKIGIIDPGIVHEGEH